MKFNPIKILGPSTRRRLAGAFGLLLALGLLAAPAIPAMADEPPPETGHIFYGIVYVGGSPAVNGTLVEAKIGGVTYKSALVTQITQPGQYSLMVPPDNPETEFVKEGGVQNDEVDFYVNGTFADSYLFYKVNPNTALGYEKTTNLDLYVGDEGGGETCNLTVTSNGCCTITVGDLGSVAAGQANVVFSVDCGTPVELTAGGTSSCCVLANWTVNGTLSGSNNPITVTVNGDTTVVANCTQLGPYTLSTSNVPSDGGSVSGGGSYSCGSTATVTATPNAGYYFTSWTGPVANAGDQTTTVLMDGSKSVAANYSQVPPTTYVLTVTSGSGGTVNPAVGTHTYAANTVVNLTATPNSCYQFAGWTGPVANASNAATTVTMDGDKTVGATFSQLGPYALSTSSSPSEGGSVSGGGSYSCGSTATVTATANAGYYFTSWTGPVANAANPTTTVLMNGSKSVTANFSLVPPTTYVLTVTVSGAGTVNPAVGTHTYAANTVVNLTATPGNCCQFSGWTGPVANASNAATTVTMDGDKTVNASFTCTGSVIDISLEQGWNTFSTPISLSPCMDTWGEFKAANNLDVLVAYSYSADTKAWVLVVDATPLKPVEGYYVCMGTAGTAQIIPNPSATPPATKELKAGLNCIGLASLEDVDVVSYLTNVYEVVGGTGYTLVLNPAINAPNDWDNNVYLRNGVKVPTMEVGKAYWVVMLNPGTQVGFTSTPLE